MKEEAINASHIEDTKPFGQSPARTSINYEGTDTQLGASLIESVQDFDVVNKIRDKKFKRRICCSVCCLVTFILIAAVFPVVLERLIRSKAIQSSLITRDNQGVWGKIPGDTEAIFVRDFTFFNFTNSEEVFLHGAKPQFREIQGFQYYERQEYLDVQWVNDDQRIKFNYWLHFDQKENTRDPNQKVRVINLGPLGFWYQLKNAPPNLLTIQGLGLLFTNSQTALIPTLLGQGISAQFLPNFTIAYQYLYYPAGIEPQNAQFLWNDDGFGMSDPNNLDIWLNASLNTLFSPQAQYLLNYFTLKESQLAFLLDMFANFTKTLTKITLTNFYCRQTPNNCTGFDLSVRQMASSDITYNIPPVKGIDPTLSICEQNVTCAGGWPEINSFYKKVFLPNHTEDQYQNLEFSSDIVRNWFIHTTPVNTNENCLLHAGNLIALWQNGTLFESSKQSKYLINVQRRFNLPTYPHAYVFWEWIKYFTYDFVNKQSDGGSSEITGIGSVSSQALYQSFSATQDNLHLLLLKYKIKNDINSLTCETFVYDSMRNMNADLANKLCSSFDIKKQETIQKFLKICRNKFGQEWQSLYEMGVSNIQMESFCDREQPAGFGYYYETAQIYLNTFYECDVTPLQYCSDYELAAKQWAASKITLNPIPQLPNIYKQSSTIHDWIKDIPAFEYMHYSLKFPNKTFPEITTKTAYKLLTFDTLFSGPVIQTLFLSKGRSFINQFFLGQHEIIQDYLRYLVIFIGFGGFTQQRSAKELIFGYYDEFLANIKYMDPAIGGDPSLPNFIHLNDINATREEAKLFPIQIYTGKQHPELVSYYYKVNGEQWININATMWNGNQTVNYVKSPWEGKDYFIGTDAKQNAADQFDRKNVSIYVINIQRYGGGNPTKKNYEKFGLTIVHAELGEDIYKSTSESDINDKYYQTFHAIFNLTSLNGIPLFASKNHFLDADSNWTQLVDIWDEKKTFKYQSSKWDDSFIDYQPYSGATFQAVIYLQTNYYHEPDTLLTYQQKVMLPVFTVNRGGNLSQNGVNKLFKPLKIGLSIKKYSLIFGIVLSTVFLGMTVGFTYQWKKKSDKKLKKDSLLNESTLLEENSSYKKMKPEKPKEILKIVQRNEQKTKENVEQTVVTQVQIQQVPQEQAVEAEKQYQPPQEQENQKL